MATTRGGALAGLVAVALCAAPAAGAAGARPRRVLSIHGYEPTRPVDGVFTAALRDALPLGAELELHTEHLDRVRFPDAAHVTAFCEWLRTRYAGAPPDVIVAIGAPAIELMASPARPFPGVPVVFGLVDENADAVRGLPPGLTGVTDHFAVQETLALALALFPDTQRVALVGGASAQDAPFNELLRREVAAARRPLEVVELFGLPMGELQERLRALPPRTVVLVVAFFQDGAGRKWSAPQSVPALASASTAPVFTLFAHVLGLGTIGGVQADFGETGKLVAGVVLRILAGERVEAIPVRRSGSNRVLLDARQLDRFGVPGARVPAGAEVRFREPSPWAGHRGEILLAGAGFLLQTALIGLLLLERRRRSRAEAKARENLVAVSRMNRIASLGELVASLAHEINSPLGAVLNNAEAAQRFMAAGAGGHAEVEGCLDDIVRDVTRAGEVIRRIRGVLRRDAWAPVPLEVAAVLRDAYHLVKAEARDRGVMVEVAIAPVLPAVTGDEVQLVQVLVNLLINALDAVHGLPEEQRRVRIAAEPAGAGVAIRVEDSGPGVPASDTGRIFEPFFTTKPTGVGMGLSISRSIVEAHGGSIRVSSAPGGGAAFEVLLPATEREAAATRPGAVG